MSKRFVNLDDLDKSVEIQIGGKKFEINRITLKAANMARDWQLVAVNMYNDISDFQKSVNKCTKYWQIKLKTFLFTRRQEREGKKLQKIQLGVIEKILQDNAIEYDEKFWRKVQDEQACEFINTVIAKDVDGKKKVAQATG